MYEITVMTELLDQVVSSLVGNRQILISAYGDMIEKRQNLLKSLD